MALLRAFLLLLGALAALTVGVAPAMASEAPPCHEMMAMEHGADRDGQAPDRSPDKPIKAMNCCVACVATPELRAPERAAPVPPKPVHRLLRGELPGGEHPCPEPGPPRPGLL